VSTGALLIILILLNIAAVIAASFSDFAAAHATGLHRFEVFSIGIFTIEYILRGKNFQTEPLQ
jgi:voltage-gated potassium channel